MSQGVLSFWLASPCNCTSVKIYIPLVVSLVQGEYGSPILEILKFQVSTNLKEIQLKSFILIYSIKEEDFELRPDIHFGGIVLNYWLENDIYSEFPGTDIWTFGSVRPSIKISLACVSQPSVNVKPY